jgi:hypothetical protein
MNDLLNVEHGSSSLTSIGRIKHKHARNEPFFEQQIPGTGCIGLLARSFVLRNEGRMLKTVLAGVLEQFPSCVQPLGLNSRRGEQVETKPSGSDQEMLTATQDAAKCGIRAGALMYRCHPWLSPTGQVRQVRTFVSVAKWAYPGTFEGPIPISVR